MIRTQKILLICLMAMFVFSCGSRRRAERKASKAKIEKFREAKKDLENKIETPKRNTVPVIKNTADYIAVYKDLAVAEMKKYGIPASITLAQGILESGSGRGGLAVKANNHFGIKCHDWTGAKVYYDDDKAQECFRKYKSPSRSFRDHSEFLANRKRYANLFTLDKDDYKAWAKGLRRAGYATDKKYPQKLISLIERYRLDKFDDPSKKRKRNKINKTYTVVKGDTLYSISRKYNITVKTLQSMNGLRDTQLSIGQVLKIKPSEKN